jgi:Zn-dependent M28 family amino/carboxypeptidase
MRATDPVNVLAEIPGESEQVILLMAPYDSRALPGIRFLGLNDGASGAALLLEVARVLASRPLPYTTWLLFLDGEAAGSDGEPGLNGSRVFAAQAKADGSLSRMRLALYTNRVCDADLRIARDLFSHRQYRDAFWDAALRLGFSDHFEQDAFQSPKAGHLAFRAAGFVQIIALQDTSFGGGDPPGAFANSEQDNLEHCAPESLEIVGRVILEGLDEISARLRKIDRFASSPMAQFREEWSRSLEVEAVVAPASPQTPAPGAAAGE